MNEIISFSQRKCCSMTNKMVSYLGFEEDIKKVEMLLSSQSFPFWLRNINEKRQSINQSINHSLTQSINQGRQPVTKSKKSSELISYSQVSQSTKEQTYHVLQYLFQKILSPSPDNFVRLASHNFRIMIEFSSCRCQAVDEIQMEQWIPKQK